MASSARIDAPGLLLSDILACWPQTIPVFIRHRMLCVGCVITPYHTVEDACREHNVSEATFRRDLRRAIGESEGQTNPGARRNARCPQKAPDGESGG